MWDGEGITFPGEFKQRYTLLATMCGDDYEFIADNDGLTTEDCLEFILTVAERDRRMHKTPPINVIYGGSYDSNMWLNSLDNEYDNREWLTEASRIGSLHWHKYRITWRPRKSFYVSRAHINGKKDGPGITIYDVLPFFQRPFVEACDSVLGKDWPNRDMVIANKALRGHFTEDSTEEVAEYNRAELVALTMLVYELRKRLNNARLRPRRWDGPGAVAAALFGRENVKRGLAICPDPVAQAARFAYAGGRFEPFLFGHVKEECYEYDINSAYPSAMRVLPNLNRGKWQYSDGNGHSGAHFSLHHVRWTITKPELPGPLYYRGKNGDIFYPPSGEGWYWSPEVDAASRYLEAIPESRLDILESWSFIEDDPTDRPFNFVQSLYDKRLALKRAGDGTQMAFKLALNSMYGKLCQQVGWRIDQRGRLHTPPFHQLEWAGYITSYCRAKILDAIALDPEAIIAVETDAVFSRRPLPLPLSEQLGDWEETVFSDLTYCQSGIYFGTSVDSQESTTKTRGADAGHLTRDEVLSAMRFHDASDREVNVCFVRFNGAGQALVRGMRVWRTWEEMTKRISVEPTGKRIHWCDGWSCVQGNGLLSGSWHRTICRPGVGGMSHEFPIEWLNPNPDMVQLSELRRLDDDADIVID